MSTNRQDTLSTRIETIYGIRAPRQLERYQQAIHTFTQHYGSTDPIHIFRAPGRVNLIGEHTDYNHGYVLPIALDRDVLLLASPRPDDQIHLANSEPNFPASSFNIQPNIPLAETGHWSNYARGAVHATVQALAQKNAAAPSGFDGLVVGAAPFGVPIGAGLSSSSALTVVMVTALQHYAITTIPEVEQVQIASDAEWYVGTRGGIMDQFIALLAQRDHALFLDCRPADGIYHTQTVPLPPDYRIMVVDSGVHHSNVRGEFNQRVAACRAGVALIQNMTQNPTPNALGKISHLRDVGPSDWRAIESDLPTQTTRGQLQAQQIDLLATGLTDMPGIADDTPLKVRARCRHVVSENQRVLDAVTAMQSNDIATFGRLMNEAHISARDDYEISCPEIDLLVDTAQKVDGVVGARLTGAGWGGCIVALVHHEATTQFTAHATNQFEQKFGRSPSVFACQSSSGAGLICTI